MSFRIINKRDEEEPEDEGCGEGCGEGQCHKDCAPQRPIFGGDEVGKWKQGEVVQSKLTGQNVMVVAFDSNHPKGYVVRLPNYEMTKMFEFELEGKEE